MESCKKLADYAATSTGAVIDALVNDNLLTSVAKIAAPMTLMSKKCPHSLGDSSSSVSSQAPRGGLLSPASAAIAIALAVPEPTLPGASPTRQGSRLARGGKVSATGAVDVPSETCAVQGDDMDRLSSWRSLIRQEFARKKSLVFYLPAIEDVTRLRDSLAKGIEDYIFSLHGDLTKKQITDMWQKIANTEHPVVVVATGSFSVLPRNDVGTVVIERENGRGWVTQKVPYLDLRRALETVARGNGQKVYLADSILRIETLRRLDLGEIVAGTPFKWRSISSAGDELVDMVKEKPRGVKAEEANRWFRTVSNELEELIKKNREDNTHLFVFAVRRGMSSVTVCDDCETIVTCNNCTAPVVLHAPKNQSTTPAAGDSASQTVSGKNFFMCHKCGERRSAEETCKNCGGWRLTPLGVGVDRVYKEIRDRFPEIDTFKIDADDTKNEKEVAAVMEKFKVKPGSVLVGTELAVAHLPDKIEHVAIASLDSLFALPDFRIPEKITYLLVRLRTIAERTILVQTRRADEKVFAYGLKGNLSDFYRQTLEDRKRFDYPPYKTLIKITIEGKKDSIVRAMVEVKKTIDPYDLEVFPAFTSTIRGNSIIHGLVRIEQNRWPDAALVAKLRALPPGISVKVDPESLL